MTPFHVYCEYLALKSHFSSPKYDYFKYNKKVRATENSFKRRKDIYFFQKMSRKYNEKEIVNFLLSNFVAASNPQNLWVGEIISSGEKNYMDWVKTQQSLSYIFKEQSQEFFSDIKIEDAFDCSNGHPPVLRSFLGGKICIETLCIYDRIFLFSKKFDKKLDDPVWKTVSLKISKYAPFLNIDIFQHKRTLREIINE